ncbi:MAG: DUF3037 domain-containing protein [Phycisphaerales bacterium]|nr:DUF3037 domain-containing protein [Phycisphaerales bacterium]
MNEYRYSLVRFVPIQERMEPINVGVILQGLGNTDIRFSPHAAKRGEVNTDVFNRWKKFLRDEIAGAPAPLFQPDRGTPRFLEYLQSLCEGPILLSPPLFLAIDNSRSFRDVLDDLYLRLVAPPESPVHGEANRPTARFRELSEDRDFVRRGMKRHEHVRINNEPLWTAYRQVINGRVIAIDKVEVGNRIGDTVNEIERLPTIATKLNRFLTAGKGERATVYYLLADTLDAPFTNQAQGEFEAMREDLEKAVEQIKRPGVEIVRDVGHATRFAEEIDKQLERLASSSLEE